MTLLKMRLFKTPLFAKLRFSLSLTQPQTKRLAKRLTIVSAMVMAMLLSTPASALVILQYHHVDTSTPAVTSISPEKFAAHLTLLEQQNKVIIDLKTALQKIDAGETLPLDAVAITFDDAWESIYTHAFPLLKQRNWPFTVFVNTQAVDERHTKVMSWEQLAELQQAGATIANHTVSHPYLLEKPQALSWAEWLDQEVTQAEQRIEEKLGVSHKMLAYPYGEFNLAIANWAKQQGYLAFGQQSGPVGFDSHHQALSRFPAAGIYANPETLKTKLNTLAMPIKGDQLLDPVLTDENPPALTLAIPSNDMYRSQVQCYASGEGAIPTEVEARKDALGDQYLTVNTAATQAITAGRGRYNCTAPSRRHKGWFYWYSQVWINTRVSNR